MTYRVTQVRISNHWQDNKFNVDLLAWQGKKLRVCRQAFAISKQDADQQAKEQSNLFNLKIVEILT